MAEACTVSQDNGRRCLPAWMLKPCSNDEVSKTRYRSEPVLESNKQPADLDQIKPAKRKRGEQVKIVDEEDADELGALQPCQGWKKVRRKRLDAVKDDNNGENAKITNKNARKVSRRSAPKNSGKRKLDNVEPEVSSSESIDDDIELTVEDLLSIAEEYVKADRLKQHEVKTTKTARYNENRCSPSISTEADIGGSIINARSMMGLPDTTRNARSMKGLPDTTMNAQSMKGLPDTAETNTAPSEPSRYEINKQQVQQCTPSFTATCDVAQDMLNIFFGPLLSKCSGYEKKPEVVQDANHATEKKDLSCDVQRQGEHATEKKHLSCDVQRQ
ncbi:uncharacterized protein [Oryza sativa Japonica Group]|uniref:Expressed protein n=3 Tax=Oryza TaxID=4527 RepID=Q8LNW0_ORYSJ|nr:uncharacterized protein LOC4348930 [Oryza sativa Japonica Group]KAB8113058.1 hypothetical protein EE612_051944 [Oryza sativa]AAM91879.1 hypothetical protein [Oryza sativa Japonica Group]AAP54322.1 expressed protein [Oryza sativa Japonica Group]EAZ16458.1 hypothetical protein OsJ_31928 [Oryza sativa Japonica Group]KAF2914082.1 hypothetical protein DAI22_10g135700 [Oryza sativa Japonica Group]|eukprot:NP_001064884.1 Os10g0483100 [Oryza sativa Japonica Group]